MSPRNIKSMSTGISIGVFLPNEDLKEEELDRLNDLGNWVNELDIEKIVLALPNLTENLINKLKKTFKNEKKIKLIFRKGEERFFSKINKALSHFKDEINSNREIDEDYLNSFFEKSEFDLIIKFGEKRIPSNFIWEKSYSEFFFLDDFVEFDKKKLGGLIEEFEKRERRFGK